MLRPLTGRVISCRTRYNAPRVLTTRPLTCGGAYKRPHRCHHGVSSRHPTQTMEPTKIILWSVPRGLSTAFFRSMMNRSDTKVLMEPFSRAYYFGTDRISQRYSQDALRPACAYSDIQRQCEAPCTDADVVFVKDMAYYLPTPALRRAYLPRGYTHTFLIRDPRRAVPSLYHMSTSNPNTDWDYFDSSETGFRDQLEMFEYVTEELGQKPIVINADDLLQDPESVLRRYCAAVGVPFTSRMVRWETLDPQSAEFADWPDAWFGNVFKSTGFCASHTSSSSARLEEDLPPDVLNVIEEDSEYYDKLNRYAL